jgi:structural maintenance of chromosome 1
MDAISFVLGVRSATLRSAALKDLIYRSGSKRKGKAKEHANDNLDQDDHRASDQEESGGSDDEDNDLEAEGDDSDGSRKAWVRAIYLEEDGTEWSFQRR